SLAHWDLRTKIPEGAVAKRSEAIGVLSSKLHQMGTSDKMKEFIEKLEVTTEDDIIKKSVEECKLEYNRNKNIPEAEFKEYVILQSKAEAAWQKAREAADFSLFEPFLEKLVSFKKKFADYWGYKDNIYDALLDQYEPGM